MSDISDVLGGWQGDPEELNNQETLLAMYSRQGQGKDQTGDTYHDLHGSHNQQALVSMFGPAAQGQQQNAMATPAVDGFNRVPIWQTRSSFGESPFQRLGFSMMFSSSSGGYQNIFTSASNQRRGPMVLLIGGTRTSGMFSGIQTENMFSNMPTENISDGPVITEIPNTPDDEDQRFLENGPLQGNATLNSNRHKNKTPVVTQTDTFNEKQDEVDQPVSLSAGSVEISEEDSQICSNSVHLEHTGSSTDKLKGEDVPFSNNLETKNLSLHTPVIVSGDSGIAPYTELSEENQDSELLEINAAATREPDIKQKTDKDSFKNECETIGSVSDHEQSIVWNQSHNKRLTFSDNRKKQITTNTTQEKSVCPRLLYSKDREESCEGKPNKNRNEIENKHVRKTTNKLTVNFNLGHLGKSAQPSSEKMKKDKKNDDEKTKVVANSPPVTDKKPSMFDNIQEKKIDLSAELLSSFSEEIEECVPNDTTEDRHTEPSISETAPSKPKRSTGMDTNSVYDNSDRLKQRSECIPKSRSRDEWPLGGSFRQDPSPTDTSFRTESTLRNERLSDQGSVSGHTAFNADTGHVNHSDDLCTKQVNQQSSEHSGLYNNDKCHSDEPVQQTGTSGHDSAVWHQDDYGIEQEKGFRYLEMVSNLRELVANEGLIVKDVYPDGNCLFAAVVDQLRVRGEFFFTPRTLRKAAVENLRSYPCQPDGTPLYCFVTDASWKEYLVRIAKEGEWGDHLIISAISNVLKRKLVILGGPTGLSRTVQEPDHAYKEITREWKQFETSIPRDQQNPSNDRQEGHRDNIQTDNRKPVSKRQSMDPEANKEEELECLYLGHLAESHYVSLRKQDWEEQLHTILRRKKDSDLLTYSSNKKVLAEGDADDAERKSEDQVFTMSPHCNFLLKVIISRCMYGFEASTISDKDKSSKTEYACIGPMHDRLYAYILNIKFETVWHRRGLPPEEKKETVSNELGSDFLMMVTVTDSFAADTRKGLNNKDLLLDWSECRPGYTRLIPVKQSVWMLSAKEGLDDKVYLKQLHLVRKTERSDQSNQTLQLLAFKCRWPDVASEWLNRDRPHGWPPENFISKIEETGCRAVPLSHPWSAEKDIEWMFYFGLAEQMLAKEATSQSQRSCFQFLKLLVEYSLGSDFKIAYSHLKTVFFYACERIEQEPWNRNPAYCVSEMIRYLTDSFEARFLPCYFVKSNNTIDDFTDSDLMFHTDRLKTLREHFIVIVYFMLDMKGQILANLHSVFDSLVSDFQQYNDHKDLGESIAECFLPCIVKHVCLYASSKHYSSMIDLAIETVTELNTTFNYEITVKDLLLKVIQSLPLEKGWLCAFFVDQKLHLSLRDRVCEGFNTVSLLDFVGEEVLNGIAGVGDDIRVPEELVTIDNIASLIAEFTTLLKDDLSLGSELYIKACMFFLDLHLNSVMEFITVTSTAVCPMKQQIASLKIRNAMMNLRLELNKIEEGKLLHKLNEMEAYLKVLEGK